MVNIVNPDLLLSLSEHRSKWRTVFMMVSSSRMRLSSGFGIKMKVSVIKYVFLC